MPLKPGRFHVAARSHRLWSRLIFAVFILAVALYGSLWAYIEYQAHCATRMLAEVTRLRIGDTEGSVLPLVARYHGFKRTLQPLPPREGWFDKDEYDYQENRQSDYTYELGISPFGTVLLKPDRLTQAMRTVRKSIPARLRPLVGMRDWGTVVGLSVRSGRVQSVSSMTFVEGRYKWLGHEWQLAEGMPTHDMPPGNYRIGAAFLTMSDGGGEMIENYITPKATEEQIGAALKFNAGCFTRIRGCGGLCDIAPSAVEYQAKHPDVAWNIIPRNATDCDPIR